MSLFKIHIIKFFLVASFFMTALLVPDLAKVSKINLSINTDGERKYIDSLILINDYSLLSKHLQSESDINMKLLEDSLTNINYVYNAEVYLQGEELNIVIDQNNPFLRVGSSFYLNKDGDKIFASSINYSDVLFFSGDIPDEKFNEICELSEYIYKDSFMNSLIKGVHYKKDLGYIFYPRFLDVKIIFGDTLSMLDKFIKIKTFYTDILKSSTIIDQDGNIKIKSINVNYNDQIICKKIDKSN